MREFAQIVSAFEELTADGRPAALATVVAVGGSSYRRPGARMLVAADGRTWGGISGGCLERDVARRARAVIEQGEPILCRYDTTESPEDEIEGQVLLDLGRTPGVTLGCRGVIDLFIERVSSDFPGPILLIEKAVREREHIRYATLIRKSAGVKMPLGMRILSDGHSVPRDLSLEPDLRAAISDLMSRDLTSKYGSLHHVALTDVKSIDLFVETLRPPQSLVIFGGGSDVVPVVELAKALGWHVTVVTSSGSVGIRQRFAAADLMHVADREDTSGGIVPEPDAAVVLMTHDFPRDAMFLASFSGLPIRYLGILGPRSRTERLLAQTNDVSQWNACFPAGLDLGADNPELIALAIVSEIQAVLAGRPGGLLHSTRSDLSPTQDGSVSREKIGILILAAGGSNRMGRPKQLLQLGGKSLVRHAAETAIEAGGKPIVVVTGSGADQVAAEVQDLPVHLAVNLSWENGMGSSVRSGVQSMLSLEPGLDALIIMLCDQPEISTTTLRKLIDAHHETGKSLCAASFGETVAPPAFFGRRYFDELLEIPEQLGTEQILLQHSADLLRVDCPEAARDVDTPADYEALKSDAD